MGFLHEGHLSLVRRSKKENDITVVSIFINPLQFGPKEDLNRYPRNIKRDKSLLKKENTEFLFIPETRDVYAEDFQTTAKVGYLSGRLCGRSRPTHFQGVATVVLKFLNMIKPSSLYLGQKDYQQFRVIEKMVEDLNLAVHVKMHPIVREKDGLAMSSRNVYLNKKDRAQAPVLYQALKAAVRAVKTGERNTSRIKAGMRQVLKKAGTLRLDYLEIVDARNLAPVVTLDKNVRVVAALAGFFGPTRLIDNILIKA